MFFDRAIPEQRRYAVPPGDETPAHVAEAIRRYRYAPLVFIFPPWRAIYCHDDERKHDFAQAEQVFFDVGAAYLAAGYRLVEVPRLSVEDRADFIRGHLAPALSARGKGSSYT